MEQRDRISQGPQVNYGGTEGRHLNAVWSVQPSTDYPSSGTQSDVTPASHHALNTAYGDLKKRYNVLQTKYIQREKQWKELHHRGSSPDDVTASSSPRHHQEAPLRTHGVSRDIDGVVNGEVTLSDAGSPRAKERKVLERQIRDVERQLRELREQLADSEHEKQQLREHVSHQEDELRQRQQHLILTENENEEMKKQMVLIKRRLRSPEQERKTGQAGAASGAGSLDLLRQGGAMDEELQFMVRGSIQAQQDVTELFSIVLKQKEVIKMLVTRIRESEVEQRRQRETVTKAPPYGIGARPKVRSASRESFRELTMGRQQADAVLVQPVECTEDTLMADIERKDGPRSSGGLTRQQGVFPCSAADRQEPSHHDLVRSLERSEGTSRKLRLPSDRYSAPAGSSVWQPQHLARENSDSDPEHHYDDIEFAALGVAWPPVVTREQQSELEPLIGPTRGLQHNDSLEHLHEDSAAVNVTDDEDIYGNEVTQSESLSTSDEKTIVDISPSASRALPPVAGSRNDTENRYRNTGTTTQQRSINIERNEYDNQGATPRSYDNTTQNVNLNRSGLDKFPSNVEVRQDRHPILNNNPLVGHKAIPHRNIYREPPPGGAAADNVAPPPRVAVEQVVVQEGVEPRNCPVCMEDFSSSVPMEEFQQHVLECTGLPERICPMCETTFPEEVPQSEFERHVNSHFEDDSLISRYEVIRE